MDEKTITDLILQAQQGDQRARQELIVAFKPYMAKIASDQCGRYLDWSNDDELSITLLAFNDAIDKYIITANSKFTTFAAMVIRRRLIDYFRKEGKHRHLLISQITDEGQYFPGEQEEAEKDFHNKELQANRQEELLIFTSLLESYGITLEDLVAASPKHLDTKQNLATIAQALVANPQVLHRLSSSRQLPIKELMALTG
ncbi:MAG: sigma factor, partial [Bacillota bacterium]|nr:sigma factor [Bacillota bacterium]